jgi:hypothetical protein
MASIGRGLYLLENMGLLSVLGYWAVERYNN